MRSKNLYRLIAGVLSASISSVAFSGEAELESRIKQLEEMLKTVQQQRAEQDKQLEILTKEIVGVENQLSQSKNAKTEEKGSSKGNPVYANNKDGLVFEDGTGKWSFQVNGRIQADYRNIDPQEWKNDTFSIRRARLGGTFNFLKDFAVRVEGEYSNTNDGSKSTTALTYGYLDWKHFQGAKVRIGQFKPIFGLERGESTNFTDFQEISLATATGASFNSTYDRGIMLFGSPIKGTYYNLSYVNGSGQNNDSMTNSKDIVGRIAINAAELANWNNSVIHFGLSGSHSNVQGSKPTSTNAIDRTLSAYTESNGITSNSAGYTNTTATKFFSASAFDDDSIDKNRLGVETALSVGSVKFQGEYINTNFDGHTSTGANVDKDINAWYASATWLVTGESYSTAYKDGMFGRIRPNNDFDLDKGTWGAWELGIRYSSFDASDFNLASDGCTSGSGCLAAKTTSGGVTTSQYTNKADAWTAGAKWILNPNARIVLNYIHTNFDTPVIINSKPADHENAVTMRAQYDF
jgi:phosphate-selective porin OprO/OprP